MNILTGRKKQILDLLWSEPIKIGHWVGLDKLGAMHDDWLRSFLWGREDQTLLAHRGSYKTTVISLFLALHAVVNPNETTLFFRKTDPDTKDVIRQTANILQSECMREIATQLFGRQIGFTKLTDNEISTDLVTRVSGQSQILGLGIGTSVTGKHADVVVTDDIVNLIDRVSRAKRDETKRFYQELQNVKNRTGRFINTGTPWHEKDAISMMPNVSKFDCYSTGMISKPDLQALRRSMSDSLFAANYELRHIADGAAMFVDPRFTSDLGMTSGGLAHIDAAYGGEDWTAYTVLKQDPGGKWYGFGKCWQKHVDDCLDRIEALHEAHGAGSISVELNADKGYLAKELKNRGFKVRAYHEKMNKFIKISTYLRQVWPNLLWTDDTDPEYIAQILDYTEFAEHDDCPDSAASLVRQMLKKASFNNVAGGI